jgi:hypothetical protein
MYPTPVVATARPVASTTQGAHHRCFQLRWWPLLDLPPAPPRGPAIDVSNFGGGRCRTCRQHPEGACHRHLQLRWSPLSDLPPAPPRSPQSTSPTSVVATAGPTASTPRGPTIDVSNSDGGRCWTCQQQPSGARYRVSNSGGGCYRIFRQHPLGGPPSTFR